MRGSDFLSRTKADQFRIPKERDLGKRLKDGKRRELEIDRCFSWSAKKSWRGGRREGDATEERDKRNLNEGESGSEVESGRGGWKEEWVGL